MPAAYVLINTEIGAEEEVVKELKKISYIKEAYVVQCHEKSQDCYEDEDQPNPQLEAQPLQNKQEA